MPLIAMLDLPYLRRLTLSRPSQRVDPQLSEHLCNDTPRAWP